MGLTSGTGPFGDRSAGRFNFEPDPPTGSVLYFDPVPYRLRGLFAGEVVFDTVGAKLLYETAHLPVYYVPEEDLRHDLLEPSGTQTRCPHKGMASIRDLVCFFNERVDLELDGQALERPVTRWSR